MSPSLRRTSNRGKKIADATTPASNDNQKVVAKASTWKRVREAEETVIELERAPAKKAKVPTTDTQPGPRRSGRSPKPNGKGVIEKRKRRTKAEVQAAKAAAEEAKKKKEEERKEATRRLEQMDVNDIEDRVQTAAKMIRRLSDVESNDGSDSGEEFVGFNEVASSSSNESEGDNELEVSSIPENLRPKSNAYHYASMQVNYKALQKEMEALRKQIENGGGRKKRSVGGKAGKKRYAVIGDKSQHT